MRNKLKFALLALCVAVTFVGPAIAATINDTAALTGYTPYNIAYEIYNNGLGINADVVPVYIHNTAAIGSAESKNLRVFNGKVNLSGQNVFLLSLGSNITFTGPGCTAGLVAGTTYIVGESTAGAVPSEVISLQIYDGPTFCTRNNLLGTGSPFNVTTGAISYISTGMGTVNVNTGIATTNLFNALNFNVDPNLNPTCTFHPVVQLAFISANETSNQTPILIITQQFTGSQVSTALNAELNTDTDFTTFKLGSGPNVVDANNILTTNPAAFTINNLQAANPTRWKAWVASTNTGSYSFQLNSINPEPPVTITASDNGFSSNCSVNGTSTVWACGQTGQLISNFTSPPGFTRIGIHANGTDQMNPTIWSITNATITISGGTVQTACFAPSGTMGGITGTYTSYTLAATKGGLGSGTISASRLSCENTGCSGRYGYNTMVDVTATPSAGSSLAIWAGCDSVVGNTCTVTMTSDKSVRAIFTLSPPPPNPFTDVPSTYWAYAYIMAIYNAGYTTGSGVGTFLPEETVTREQMAAFIVRAADGEPPTDYCSAGPPFPDCSTDSWSCKYIKRLSELGLTTGYGTTGLYMPSLDVTRAQMAAFIERAVEGEPPPNYCSSGSPFSDVITSEWSCVYIKRLYELGIITGYGDGRYGPEDLLTRAQMAVFLGRAFLGME